jgi:hypothetical protein
VQHRIGPVRPARSTALASLSSPRSW